VRSRVGNAVRVHCERALPSKSTLQDPKHLSIVLLLFTSLRQRTFTCHVPSAQLYYPGSKHHYVADYISRPLLLRTAIMLHKLSLLSLLSHIDSASTRHGASIWPSFLDHCAEPALALLGPRGAVVLPHGVQADGSEGEESGCDWESGMRGEVDGARARIPARLCGSGPSRRSHGTLTQFVAMPRASS
jgi:hypothetical protein